MVDEDVYDLTKFQHEHPGGQKSKQLSYTANRSELSLTSLAVLTRVGGKDASKQFWKYHNEGILKKYKAQLQIGSLDSKKQEAAPPTPPASPSPEKRQEKATDKVKPQAESGVIAPVPTTDAAEAKESMDPYGAMIPYSDPSWYHGVRHSGSCQTLED